MSSQLTVKKLTPRCLLFILPELRLFENFDNGPGPSRSRISRAGELLDDTGRGELVTSEAQP